MKNYRHLIATGIFILATLILTWPLALHMTDSYPSTFVNFGGDPNMYISFMDLTAKKFEGKLPTDLNKMIFYPNGINLAAGYEAPVMLVVSLPVVLITHNPILAYNLILLLGFILSCLACYFFILYLTDSYYSAMISGFSFGLSTYMLVRGLQHIDLLFLFVVPLMALAAFKFVDKPNYKSVFWLAASVFLAAISAWYYLMAGLFFLGIVFLFNIKNFLRAKKIYIIAFLAVTLSILITSLPIILNKSDSSLKIADATINNTGAQPLNFFVPHPFTDLWQNLTLNVYKKFPSVYEDPYPYFESTSHFGLVGIIALVTLFFLRKKIKIPNEGLWITTAIILTILAMGTYLQLGHWKIPMPFAVLHGIFPFDRLRAPNRFFVFAYLTATVIFGYFLAAARGFFKTKRSLVLFTVILLLLLVCERLNFPYPLVKLPVSKFYTDIGQDHANYALVDLPIDFPGYSEYNYYQVFHNKPIVDGEFFWTVYNSKTFDFVKSNALLKNSAVCDPDFSDIHPEQALAQLAADNIRFVVVHNFIIHDDTKCAEEGEYIRKFFAGQKSFFSDGEITVYSTIDKLKQ